MINASGTKHKAALVVRLPAAAGGCWRLLEAAGGCWRLLEAAGGCWRLLEAAGGCWRLLEASAALFRPPERLRRCTSARPQTGLMF
ncbi:hypothetical protein GBF38_001188 [Nibea albiflora]|uniref:Uncharacterized protein n=1 Tax=Nibea albiflora TaxID=240163 RepID=A0ACB7ETQ9_NIBAL|nr:hypothetical protein GBF38_001188 [Nibea albiflora]